MSDLHTLSKIILEDVNLTFVEKDIYSVYSIGDLPGAYDSIGASVIYDRVACNRELPYFNREKYAQPYKRPTD